ncbi:MAG: FCD domain-containing protein [Oleiphilaceae bacterium]|nr:FCD domain-containing protein [Oleiphilaceae bacterium]
MEKKLLSTSQAIAHRLENLILDGSLAPEQKMASERQLASSLRVSRSVIREALHELQGRGVIETRHGQGSFVARILPEPEDESPLMQLFFGHSRTLYDLFEVREQLEGQASFLAAQRATDKDRYLITKAFNAMEEADPLTNADLDHAFHRAIVNASHNPVLVHVLDSLKTLMLHSVHASVSNLSHRASFKQQIDKHHRRIYQAIMNGQAAAAQKAAAGHVAQVREALRKIEEEEKSIIRAAVEE